MSAWIPLRHKLTKDGSGAGQIVMSCYCLLEAAHVLLPQLGTGIICHDLKPQTKATPLSPTLSKLHSKHSIWRNEKYPSLAGAAAGW